MFHNDNLKGKLLHTDRLLEIWYVSPKSGKKCRVTLDNVTRFFKRLFSGVTSEDLDKIPMHDQPETGKNITLRKKLAGRLLQVKNKKDIWYVDTENYKRWEVDLFRLMDMLKAFSTRVTDEDLNNILTNDINHV